MSSQRRLGSAYVLERVLGEGASGQVWLGRDNEGNTRAFKLLRPELATDPGIVNRFVQERSLLASIQHPNVVQVHDLVIEGGTLAIVMDYVDGVDLRGVIRTRGSIVPAQLAQWGEHIALALGAAHANGVIHRDVKPENVLLESSTDKARLTDFGIAKLVDGAQRSTMLLGTPQYMAPEIAEGRAPSPAADVYSLGVMLYEMCCGVPPFAGRGPAMATLRAHAVDVPGRPSSIADPLWELIASMLEKSPADRPASATAVAEALHSLKPALDGLPPAPRLAVPPPPRTTTPFGVPAAPEDPTILAGSGALGAADSSDTVFVDRSAGSRSTPSGGSSVRPPVGTSMVGGPYPTAPQQTYAAGVLDPGAQGSGRIKNALVPMLAALAGIAVVVAAFLLWPRPSTPEPQPVSAASSPALTSAPAPATTMTNPQPTVTVTPPPPPVTVTVPAQPSITQPAVPPPTQAEAAAVVNAYSARFRSGTLTRADMDSLFTPTIQWYGKKVSRAELYDTLSRLDRQKNQETYDQGVYRSFDGDVRYGSQPSSTINYYVSYDKASGESGAVIVHYTIVKDAQGVSRITSVTESKV